jgi:hypothetical protein
MVSTREPCQLIMLFIFLSSGILRKPITISNLKTLFSTYPITPKRPTCSMEDTAAEVTSGLSFE